MFACKVETFRCVTWNMYQDLKCLMDKVLIVKLNLFGIYCVFVEAIY